MRGLRVIAAVLFAYHLGIGVVSVLSADATAAFARQFYGLDIRIDAQFIYVLKALGMYALFTASVLGLLIWRPQRFRPLAYCMAGLQLARAATRLLFYDVLAEAFAVSVGHNLFNVALLVIEAGLLLWFARSAVAEPERL